MIFTKEIKDEMQRITNVVSSKFMSQVYPNLGELKGCIQAVNFKWGHFIEILETLQQNADSQDAGKLRYPMIALLTDIPINRLSGSDYPTANMRLIMAHVTEPNYKASEREEYLFQPILRPIYTLWYNELKKSTFFNIDGTLIPHVMTERYFWGKTGLFGNSANTWNEYIDGIEITNLNLRINKIC